MVLLSGYLWFGFALVWMLWAIRTKPTERRESKLSRLSYALLLPPGFYLLFARRVPIHWLNAQVLPDVAWVREAAVALTAAGLLFAIWARLYLGTNWSGTVTVKVGHELVRSGPYRWVRHPIYSGLLLASLGTAAERGEVRGLIAIAFIYAGFWMKLRTEERFMADVFGSKYAEYKRDTGALIPRVIRGSRDNTHS
jgi:protein-S-isoprenylcysteine O-methyltransferase Ste14